MNPEKIERCFWLLFGGWLILRSMLLWAQYTGSTDPAMTSEVLKFFSQADISAGREYALRGFWFKTVYGILYALALVALLRFGVFSLLWQKAGTLAGAGTLRADLVFIVVFLLIIELLSLPSAIYFGHIRETAAGFARIDFAGWLLKHAKAVGLGMLLETVVIMLFLAVIRWFPGRWPFIVPVVMGGFGLAVTFLVPLVITPLFYSQRPLEQGEFREGLLKMADKAGMSVKEIYVIDESRYSSHTNAYFTGVGSFRRIVLYDTLIKSHTPDEAALIFAHEAGHWRHNHVAWGLSLGALGVLLSCLAWFYLYGWLEPVPWFGLQGIGSAANIPFLMIVVMFLQLFVSPVESQVSQFMERQADRAALELTGLRDVYINAQIRLSCDNKSDLLPHPFRVFWLYTHPPAIERIKAAQ